MNVTIGNIVFRPQSNRILVRIYQTLFECSTKTIILDIGVIEEDRGRIEGNESSSHSQFYK